MATMIPAIAILFPLVLTLLVVRYGEVLWDWWTRPSLPKCESCGTRCKVDTAATGGSHICYNCFMHDELFTEIMQEVAVLKQAVADLRKENKEMSTCIKVLFKRFYRPEAYARTMDCHSSGQGAAPLRKRLTYTELVKLGPEVASLNYGASATLEPFPSLGCLATKYTRIVD